MCVCVFVVNNNDYSNIIFIRHFPQQATIKE